MLGDQTEIGRCAEESLSATAVFVLPEIRKMSAVMAMSVFLVITGNHLFGGGEFSIARYCRKWPEVSTLRSTAGAVRTRMWWMTSMAQAVQALAGMRLAVIRRIVNLVIVVFRPDEG